MCQNNSKYDQDHIEGDLGEQDEQIEEELGADGRPVGVEKEEFTPYPFDVKKISIVLRQISLSNIVRRIQRGSIIQAEIQRRADLWKTGMKSRLIESIILKIPLPFFYASEDINGTLHIIDGLQRISAIRGYLVDKKFKLKDLEFLSELEGKKFDDLDEELKIRIDETELHFRSCIQLRSDA